MIGQEILDSIGFDRARLTQANNEGISESESVILRQVADFGIDAVYFNTDSNKNSFPAVFLKKVESFDQKSLRDIANVHKRIWNYKKVLFLYVYSDVEIRIYNCSEKPLILTKENFDYEKEVKKLEIGSYKSNDKKQLEELIKLFSSVSIDSGVIWSHEEALFVRDKINLKRRVDKYLVDSLVNTAEQLEKQGLEVNFIHKIILRSLFLLYLEDRKATDESFYSEIKKGAKSYFDILNDVNATYLLFHKLEDHFNGNVFTFDQDEQISEEQLQLVKTCFISGNDNTPQIDLFEDWRVFDFSIIQIELLSEIYENFLFKTDPELKKSTGTYYTPPSLVEFILNEKLPVNNGETDYDIKILDPSCGSGIFLVESFKRLVKRHENFHGQKLTDFDTLKELLVNHIYGIELHPQAIKVAAFSLYLALVDNLNPKTVWRNKNHSLPNLINNPEDQSLNEQGYNLFCRDTIEVNREIESIEFDLIIGNPPFGTSNLSSSVSSYCAKFDFPGEMVLPFLHKATKFARPKGQIALIFNTKVLTNTGRKYRNFRKWLFNDCYVDRVYNFSILRNAKKNFGGQLFGDATGPISIVHYQKGFPEFFSDRIAYYAPKTYIKSSILDGLNIDSTDLKYLPRKECQKPESKIWKITMWGTARDFDLVERLMNSKVNVGKYLSNHRIQRSVGLQPLNKSTKRPKTDIEISKLQFIRPEKLERFYTPQDSLSNINGLLKNRETIQGYLDLYSVDRVEDLPLIDTFRRVTGKGLFKGPLLLVKEGFKNKKLCSSFIDGSVAYNSSVLGFQTEDADKLRFLSCILNSELATYFLLLISNSWGIERERIKPNEVYQFPIVENENIFKELTGLHKSLETLLKGTFLSTDYSDIESRINEQIYDLYKVEPNDRRSIQDFIEYTIDLFHEQEKSKALTPPDQEQVQSYAELICDELNDFLGESGLYANSTIYNVPRFTTIMAVKLSFRDTKRAVVKSSDTLERTLKKLDKHLWEKKAMNIYFRKKLNYKTENNIYIIRPNQRRFWSKSSAIDDASELILEILNEN